MSRQDKATTERNAKILRGLVKQADSKLCADCKRNDPRWASWNLGVFLCIRCSGIHRSMGTHISRVKSIDLDIWTPEQMESIQKWGNRRANLYWEAHLRAGHIPPDHKIESFIRSKYESRRWAMEGPPPSDPAVLDNVDQRSNGDANQPVAPSRPTHVPSASLSAPRSSSPALHASGMTRQSQPQPRQLLSAAVAGRATVNAHVPTIASPTASTHATPPAPQAQSQPAQQDDFFSLDFHAPPVAQKATAPAPPAKDVKQDILSLFSSVPATSPSTTSNQSSSAFGQFSTAQTSWDAFSSAPAIQPQAQPTSMIGTNGTGAWGVSSGWNASPPSASSNGLWGGSSTTTATATPQTTTNQLNLFNTTDIWASSATTNTTTTISQTPAAPKKDDVFGDLWGDFK